MWLCIDMLDDGQWMSKRRPPAGARTQRNRESEASTQQDPERLRVDPANPVHWKCCPRGGCERAALWPHQGPEERVLNRCRSPLLPPSLGLKWFCLSCPGCGASERPSHSESSNPTSVTPLTTPHLTKTWCRVPMNDQPVEAWKSRIEWHLETHYLKDLNEIDGEQMEFEWKMFPRLTTTKRS